MKTPTHKGFSTPLVIAIMAFAVVAFLFLIDTSINPDATRKTTKTNTNGVVRQNSNTAVNNNTNLVANANTNSATDPTAGWKTYTSNRGWSVQYPTTYEQTITSGYIFPASVIKLSDTTTGDADTKQGQGPDYSVYFEEYLNDASNSATYAWAAEGFQEPFPAGFVEKTSVTLGNIEAARFRVNVTGQTVFYYYVKSQSILWQIRDTRIGDDGQNNERIIKTFTVAS